MESNTASNDVPMVRRSSSSDNQAGILDSTGCSALNGVFRWSACLQCPNNLRILGPLLPRLHAERLLAVVCNALCFEKEQRLAGISRS
ncbi:hypothetical protein COCOBI_19-0240 [Coccomyxa sp. Obi]|nr:hypothetical protein COCOBI_19-0240 [Coccomyxa sp. Obi]